MKKLYLYQFFIAILLFSVSASAQKRVFADIAQSGINTANGKRVIIPKSFRTLELNTPELKTFLSSLPSEASVRNNHRQAPVMELPMPDGSTARFHVWESSIMEEGLMNKYPEIRTYAGQGIDDPYATIRFDYNPYFGFSAQVLSAATGRIYIDPYMRGNTQYHIAYYHRDNSPASVFACETIDDIPGMRDVPVVEAGPCRGTEMFTYRLAMACTGEYATAVCAPSAPTVAATLAAIVTCMNRVNGVYETEVSLRMILIATTDQVIYLNGSTDPFTNNNGGTMLTENQNNMTAVIGAANYDIGHVVSTGGGGIAALRSPCGASKARGVTGLPNPVGDGFYIDYVAHEMGHQWGGNHTFNSVTSSCNGNRNASTAYEVGSGTSIQAYAGICGSDNIQPNSDPYFHSISFDEISNFIATGNGNTCKVATPTGNTLPVISSMSDNNVSIPVGTPFTLTGAATDANGDALTYSWEQWDLGAAGAWNSGANSTTAPLFKSRIPKLSGSRTFPDPAIIFAGFPANPPATMDGLKGETLPNVARPLKFRLTVRDNRAGGGGVVTGGDGCQMTTVFQVNTSGTTPFVVTVPSATGISYPGASTQTVTWDVAGTDAAPIGTTNVRILLSTDGGNTYPQVLAASTANDGSEAVTIPNIQTTTARVKVEAIGNIFFDISNNNFTITMPVLSFDFTAPAPVNIPCASGTTATSNIATTASGGYSTPINLSATSGVPAGTTVTFGTNPVTPGSSSSVVLNNVNTLAPGTYDIVVTGVSGSITKTVTVRFVVPPSNPVITTQPANAEGCAGTAATFTVVATGGVSYQWQSSTDGTTWTNIAGATSASYTIASLAVNQNGNRFRVIVTGACGTSTSSAASLVVNTPATITGQPAAQKICVGQDATFSVTATGSTITYQWQVSMNNGTSFVNVVNGGAYSGATTATLLITNPSAGFNANIYRVIVSGVPCGAVNSANALLTVNNSPGVVLVAAERNNLTPYTPSGLFATVSPAAGTYTYSWTKDGAPLTGVTTASFPVNVDDFGVYDVTVTDANGCSSTSNKVTLADSADASLVFIYPNPSAGIFQVRYYSAASTDFSVNVYDSKGRRVWSKQYPVNSRYEQMLVDLGRNAAGVYKVEVRDRNGKRLAGGNVLIQR